MCLGRRLYFHIFAEEFLLYSKIMVIYSDWDVEKLAVKSVLGDGGGGPGGGTLESLAIYACTSFSSSGSAAFGCLFSKCCLYVFGSGICD